MRQPDPLISPSPRRTATQAPASTRRGLPPRIRGLIAALLAIPALPLVAASQTDGLPDVTIPLKSDVRYTPEEEWDGMTVVPVGDTVWRELFLVHLSRYQVVAIFPGDLPEATLGGPGVDLLVPQLTGPPAPPASFSPLPPKQGWPAYVGEESFGTVTAVDLGEQTGLAMPSSQGLVYLFDGGGRRAPGWPLRTASPVSSPIATGDLDGDRRDDLVFACLDGTIQAVDQRGRPVEGWPVRMPGADPDDYVAGCPTVADLDGDGVAEVVASTRAGFVAAWSCRGRMAGPFWPMRLPAARNPANGPGIHSSPAVADLDGDGLLEIMLGTGAYRVFAWHADGRPVEGWPVRTPGRSRAGFSSPVVGDLDGDGSPEVILGTDLGFESGATVVAAEPDGTFPAGWPAVSPERINAAPALADLNGDERPEVVAVTIGGDGRVLVLDGTSGRPLPGWPVTIEGVSFNSSPVVSDVDADGSPDILVAGSAVTFNPRVEVVALDKRGRSLPGWPLVLETESILTSSPLVIDLDRDGILELILGTEGDGRIYAWQLPTADRAGAAPWPMFQANAQRTGAWPAGATRPAAGSGPGAPPERSRSVDPNNPLTMISFTLNHEDKVKLTIVNVMGQPVRTLLSHTLPPGRYAIAWDGEDDSDIPQPAGIYFYDLRIGSSSASHQMLLLK